MLDKRRQKSSAQSSVSFDSGAANDLITANTATSPNSISLRQLPSSMLHVLGSARSPSKAAWHVSARMEMNRTHHPPIP
ncbi:hypothetical protein MAPG_04409 [Magnaporthiopsis poae ATCC 64411]|uniref:Uncharacterized protein n=1 Tax=Magnaporthiopsis poae (strain ATCC 64411 / 73-15) TaxID=644358 RepID=A0A0C4DWN0_MAGP6|nr:hypothetical protein MAPG_04409 [Magnaporthiopsis poae ATCC 64411]